MVGGRRVARRTARRTSRRMNRRAEQRRDMQDMQAPEPAPAAASQAPGDQYEQLQKLGELHAQGILTDEEFAAEKAKLLGN